jgi:serine O-acetyltransferase
MTIMKVLKGAFTVLSSVRLIPLIPVMLYSPNRNTLYTDMNRYASVYHLGQPRNLKQRILLFAYVMTWLPEFRNIFYLRTGLPGRVFSVFCPPLSSLKLGRTSIGPGLFVLHGEGTQVSAVKIGENCWMTQQVVIGYTNETDIPTIGNNVTIHAGAKVLGKVKVGDNATIGANSVVIADVPPNVTVMGVPAKIIWGKVSSGLGEVHTRAENELAARDAQQ